ncbi:DNA repair protein RecN [Exilibacterium tricleocarpae]|uniref:DNA repair protein RecN n=1 Tax=Exilibacterium tricleocarpae TaxID=2591008 RepID=A0A545TBC7_9GAMM|nr:DNA repair protein RecN [Exilibacterium tricleocarpae]TQV74522.1 DNA repair protein RecN [Exilibacterium tricleocarpae]
MLTHLSVNNFTLVDTLDREIAAGMTVLTGETGAGKSIMLDALGLALGDRAAPDQVRTGAERADIHANFDVSRVRRAQQWLAQHDLDNGDDCLLRRVITAEGRSRAYINGQPATAQQLRVLGEMLIDIHSQHEHQSLLKKDTHRRLLDEFGNHTDLAREVRQAHREWQDTWQRYTGLRDNAEEVSARYQLLRYQVEELTLLELEDGDLEALETEQKTLANAEVILQTSQQVAHLCSHEDQCLQDGLNRALHQLQQLPERTAALANAEQLIGSALIQVEEAHREIEHHIGSFNADPARLAEVETRLSAVYDIARKHRVRPEQLGELLRQLQGELQTLSGEDAELDALEAKSRACEQTYRHQAEKLSSLRQKTARRLGRTINAQLKDLAMATASLEIDLQPLADKAGPHGLEAIEFLISTNPGQPPRPLAKVASGGELSRISLAIQVVTAKTSTTPTLVFDEVDVGIGGATADVVGRLLRTLGEQGQVICVTHLAQVASKAHQHLLVSKQSTRKKAQSTLVQLSGEDKVAEIARMLGGAAITEQSRAHAREMMSAD